MGFLDKAKAAAEQAANRAKEGVEEVQAKRSLSHAYEELGRTAYDLIDEGQISHQRMTLLVEEIRKIRAEMPADGAHAAAPVEPAATGAAPGEGAPPTA